MVNTLNALLKQKLTVLIQTIFIYSKSKFSILFSSHQEVLFMRCKINVRSCQKKITHNHAQPYRHFVFTWLCNCIPKYYHTKVYEINTLYLDMIIVHHPLCNSINSMQTKLCKTVHD